MRKIRLVTAGLVFASLMFWGGTGFTPATKLQAAEKSKPKAASKTSPKSGAEKKVADKPEASTATRPASGPHPALKFWRNELAQAEGRLKEAQARLRPTLAAAESAEKKLAAAKEAGGKASRDFSSVDSALKTAVKARPGLEKNLISARAALKGAESKKPPVAAEIAKAKAQLKTSEEALQKNTADIAALTKQRKEAEQVQATASKSLAAAQEAVKPQNDAKLAANKEIEGLEKRIASLRARLETYDKTPLKFDPKAIRLARTLTAKQPLIACEFDHSGTYLYTGARDRTVHRWTLQDGTSIPLEGHRSWVKSLNVSSDDSLLVSASYSGDVIWWDAKSAKPKPMRTVAAHRGFARTVAISPDKKWVATGGNDGLVRIWSAEDGTQIKELSGHERHVYNLAFHPSGKFLVSGDLMGNLKQWETENWKHVRDLDAKVLAKYDNTFKADIGGIRGIDFSRDGKYLVVSGISEVTNAFAGIGKPTAVLFDVESGKRLKVFGPKDNFTGTCWGVRFDPTGEYIIGVGGGGSGMLWVWTPASEKAIFDFKLPGVAYDLDIHPDGLRIACALYNSTAAIYDFSPLAPGEKPAKTAATKTPGKKKAAAKKKPVKKKKS